VNVTAVDEYGNVTVADAAGNSLLVGDQFHHDRSPVVGCKLAKLNGFLQYTYGAWRLEPRSPEDFVAAAGSNCEDATSAATIPALQQLEKGLSCDGSQSFINLQQGVSLTGLVVVSPKFSAGSTLDGYFVSDGVGGPYSGVELAVAKSLGTNFAIGAVLDVTGEAKEYYCMTEVQASEVNQTGTINGPVPVASLSYAALSADFEKYEGVLVELSGVKVGNAQPEHGAFDLEGGLNVGVLFNHGVKPAANDVFATLRGVIVYSFSAYHLEPRSANDLVK